MLFSIFASLAVAIAVAAGSKLLMVQTASSGMGLVNSEHYSGHNCSYNLGHILLGVNQASEISFHSKRQWIYNAPLRCSESGCSNSVCRSRKRAIEDAELALSHEFDDNSEHRFSHSNSGDLGFVIRGHNQALEISFHSS
jgi:hypothetical protein